MTKSIFSFLLLMIFSFNLDAQFSRELCDYYDETGTLYENIKTENTIAPNGDLQRSLITTKDASENIITTTKIENIYNTTSQITRQIITDYQGAINLGVILSSSKEENLYSPEGYLQRSIITYSDASGIAIKAKKTENINNTLGQATRQIITDYNGGIFTGTITGSTKEENIYSSEGFLQRSIFTSNDENGNAISAIKIENINNISGQITRQIITNYNGDIFTGTITGSTKEENIYSPEGFLQRSIFTSNDENGSAISAIKIENINNITGQITRQIITNYIGDIFTGTITGSTKEENIYSPEGFLQRTIFSDRDPMEVVFFTRKTELINNAQGSVQRNITTEYNGPLPDADLIAGLKIENLYDSSNRIVRVRISRLIDDEYVLESQCSYIYPSIVIDADEDGFSAEDDCDDNDATINPDAMEICDGVDNNCDGTIDEGFQLNTYFADTDGDGFGDVNNSAELCTLIDGYVSNSTDCDDTNASIYPDATEICDGVDNNCNGDIDEDIQTNYFQDADGDGFGNPDSSVIDCTPPTGYVTDATDCNDADAEINPGAEEIVNNGIDENCDGMDSVSSLEELNSSQITFYPNPVSDILTIDVKNNGEYSLKMYDVHGKIILTRKDAQTINVSKLESGIYWIEILNNETTSSHQEKIIITH